MSLPRSQFKVTYDQYRALPETGPRYQLIDGELIMSPAPTSRHQEVLLRIASALLAFVVKSHLGRVFCSPIDVILSSTEVLQPDIAFVASARDKMIAREGIFGAPDLWIEVLSESTKRIDLGVKKTLFAKHGVREYWVVEPDENWIEIFRFEVDATTPQARFGSSEVLTSGLLPGFALDLATIFLA